MAHVHCILDNWGYRHTRGICIIYCFSTAKMVTRTRLGVTLDVYWLSHDLFSAAQEIDKFCEVSIPK